MPLGGLWHHRIADLSSACDHRFFKKAQIQMANRDYFHRAWWNGYSVGGGTCLGLYAAWSIY